MHRVDTIVSDERDKVEENSITSIQSSLESMASVLSDDGQETDRDTTNKKPISKKSPAALPYFKGMSEQISRVFKQMTSRLQAH